MLRRLTICLAFLLCLTPAAAHALFGTPGPGERLLQPPSQYFLPMEAGALDNHADLQLLFTAYSIDLPPFLGGSISNNVVQLGVDGQIAIFDRFQVGVNIPFLTYNNVGFSGGSTEGTRFGNMLLRLKLRLLGSSSGPYAFSVFLNTLLPTMTDLPTHDFAALQPGAALSLGFSRLTFNVALSFYENFTSEANGLTALLLDAHLAAKIWFLAPYVGFQLGEPMAGDLTDVPLVGTGHDPAVALSAGVQFFPLSIIHLDLGTRIALDDNGKLFYGALGRATLVFAAGLRF